MNPKEKLQVLRDESGVITSDREEMASILNNQFKSVFREEDTNTIPEFSKKTQVIFGIEDVIKK